MSDGQPPNGYSLRGLMGAIGSAGSATLADAVARGLASSLSPEGRARGAAAYIARGIVTPTSGESPDVFDLLDVAAYIANDRHPRDAVTGETATAGAEPFTPASVLRDVNREDPTP